MVHIGKEIKKKAQELRVGPTELAMRISVSKQNIYHIYERKSIDTDLLEIISKALEFDFFQFYFIDERDANYKTNADRIMQEQEQKIKDQEATIRVLTHVLEDLRINVGLSPEIKVTQEFADHLEGKGKLKAIEKRHLTVASTGSGKMAAVNKVLSDLQNEEKGAELPEDYDNLARPGFMQSPKTKADSRYHKKVMENTFGKTDSELHATEEEKADSKKKKEKK